jgi:hypothetical protein
VPLVKTRILESITARAHAGHALEVPREMSLIEVTEFLRQRGQVHIGADTESRQRILKASMKWRRGWGHASPKKRLKRLRIRVSTTETTIS